MCAGPEAAAAAETTASAKGAAEITGTTMTAAEATAGGATAIESAGGVAQLAGPGMVEGATAALGENAFGGAMTLGASEATAAGVTGADMLATAKAVAPVVGAVASLVGAGAGAMQAQNALKAAADAKAGVATPPTAPQAGVDADVSAIQKKNALLFSADSPASTDLTKGSVSNTNVGKSLLLGGSSKLGN